MKKYLALISSCTVIFLSATTAVTTAASETAPDKPVKHLHVADVTSMEEAKRVFQATTAQLKTKTKLDEAELSDIHFITYSLEKAVAYFSENLEGETQKLAKDVAEVVESIHIASENGRRTPAKQHLDDYFTLAEALSSGL